MKVLHINRSDTRGGAAIATYRLHQGLRKIGIDSKMLVLDKSSDDPHVWGLKGFLGNYTVKVLERIEQLPVKFYHGIVPEFHAAWFSFNFYPRLADLFSSDVVHLHWITGGLLRPFELTRLQPPLFWTLHDMWPFTGGCHYSWECEKFQEACKRCPQLPDASENDFSKQCFQRKQEAFGDLDLNLVANSHWMASKAEHSQLFKNHDMRTIHYGLDLDIFNPEKSQGSAAPTQKKIILSGAVGYGNNPRKGFDLLRAALEHLSDETCSKTELKVFGTDEEETDLNLPLESNSVGTITDTNKLAEIYAQADVMVVPSRYEAFGQTASEALACGTPVVSFEDTGVEDIVDHLDTGYLAKKGSPESLAKGIEWVLNEAPRDISKRARSSAKDKFELKKQAQEYAQYYKDVIDSK